MTWPVEVEIEQLVLRGIQEADVPAVLAAFRRHLAVLLRDPATPRTPVTEEVAPGPDAVEASAQAPDGERLGRELAAAVARVVRR
ncbi:hypothetical protein [Kitasatospora sp. NPDC088346]|uniref:hypothetical protein n=1 Tax=Kitasatospora sp. NPDC088346 TaxID=3364073 RepID=UPI0038131907